METKTNTWGIPIAPQLIEIGQTKVTANFKFDDTTNTKHVFYGTIYGQVTSKGLGLRPKKVILAEPCKIAIADINWGPNQEIQIIGKLQYLKTPQEIICLFSPLDWSAMNIRFSYLAKEINLTDPDQLNLTDYAYLIARTNPDFQVCYWRNYNEKKE